MALISADLGVTDKTVIELQIIRMVVVISVFPLGVAGVEVAAFFLYNWREMLRG